MGIALIVACLFVYQSCFAQMLNYKDAVIDSLRHSPSLSMKIEDIRISNATYQGNFAGLYPTINIGGRAERYENLDTRNSSSIQSIGNEVVGGNQSAWRSSVSLSGQYYFSHWYKKRFEANYYEKLKDSSVHQCDAEAKKIIHDVTDIYGALVEGKIKLQYSMAILQYLQEIHQVKKEAFTQGQFSYEEVLKAETEAVNMEKEASKIKKEINETALRLTGYTGSNYTENTDVEKLAYTGQVRLFDENNAIIEAPEYKARRKELEAVQSKEKAAKYGLLPDISVYGRYDLFNSSPESLDASMRDTRPSSYSVGLYVSLPLFDGGAKIWEWKKSRYEIRKQEENVRATFEEQNKTIRTLQAGHENLTRSYRHYQKLHEQYEKMFAISSKAQTLGERSKLDMLELKKDALTVEQDLKVAEQTLAVYEKQLTLEMNYTKFVSDYNGHWACSY